MRRTEGKPIWWFAIRHGGANPEEVTQVIGGLVRKIPLRSNSDSMAIPIAVWSCRCPSRHSCWAVQVQGTLLGTGERCGNVNLTTVIGSMQLRGEAEFVTPEALSGLTSLAHSAYAAFSLDAPHGTPIVGPGAFWHLGRNARQQRTQKPRSLPVVRSRQSRGQAGDRSECAIGKSQHWFCSRKNLASFSIPRRLRL